jgi:hypothetical protein
MKDMMIINIASKTFSFKKKSPYNEVKDKKRTKDIQQLLKNKRFDVTCEVTVLSKKSEIETSRDLMKDILSILSFLTCNYVSIIYEDIFCEEKLIKSVHYKHKYFDYIDGLYMINPHKEEILKKVVENGYANFKQYKSILGLNELLELYLLSIRERIIESKYVIIAVAIETIASYTSKYSKYLGVPISNTAKTNKEKDLLKLIKKKKIRVTDQFIEELLIITGYNNLKLPDKLRFIFERFNFAYEKTELDDFLKYRNIMIHSGISKDYELIMKQYYALLSLFDRFILTVLNWKGNPYIDKSNDFAVKTLK